MPAFSAAIVSFLLIEPMKHLSPRPATPVLPVCRSSGRRGWRCLEQTTANPTRILAPFRSVWKANRDIRQPAAARTWYVPTAATPPGYVQVDLGFAHEFAGWGCALTFFIVGNLGRVAFDEEAVWPHTRRPLPV